MTDEEFVNAVFKTIEQVNQIQTQLLRAAFILASGGPAQAHIGTGGGGSSSDLPWGKKKKDKDGMRRQLSIFSNQRIYLQSMPFSV